MIPINRPQKPVELDATKISELTARYKLDESSVWNQPYIRSALLDMSHNKCVYCESKVDEESKYMEVDHFLPKSIYQDLVVFWKNLLPSCKRCNTNKLDHDSESKPIIDPSTTLPNEHIGIRNYRLKGKNQLGRDTIDIVDLNESIRCTAKRFAIGEQVTITILQLHEILETYRINHHARTRNRLTGGIRRLLAEASPSSEYSATAATAMCSDEDFAVLVQQMKALNLWDPEMEAALTQANSIAFELL